MIFRHVNITEQSRLFPTQHFCLTILCVCSETSFHPCHHAQESLDREILFLFFFFILLFLFRMKHQCSRGNRSLHFLGLFWGGGTKLLFSSGENEPFQEELGNCGSCSLLPSPYVILHSKQDRWPDRSSLLSLYFHLVPSSLYFVLLIIASQLICTTAHLLVLGQASAVKATVTQENILLS